MLTQMTLGRGTDQERRSPLGTISFCKKYENLVSFERLTNRAYKSDSLSVLGTIVTSRGLVRKCTELRRNWVRASPPADRVRGRVSLMESGSESPHDSEAHATRRGQRRSHLAARQVRHKNSISFP